MESPKARASSALFAERRFSLAMNTGQSIQTTCQVHQGIRYVVANVGMWLEVLKGFGRSGGRGGKNFEHASSGGICACRRGSNR